MKMEDHFKETLNKAVENEPPVLDAWDRFERRMGRSRRWRMVVAFAGAAAVIVAAAIVVPQLGTRGVKPAPPITQPPTVIQTDGSFATFPTDDWVLFRSGETYGSQNVRYEFRHPRWWKIGEHEAVFEIRPYWLPPSLGSGEATVSATWRVEYRSVAELTAEGPNRHYLELSSDPAITLIGDVILTNPELTRRYEWIAREIIRSMHVTTEPAVPAPKPFTHLGAVASGIDSDARLEALVSFLDARLQGPGHDAERYLTTVAEEAYRSRLNLYDGETPDWVYYEYEILSREDADANSSEFVIKITVARAQEDGTAVHADQDDFFERVFVGAGRNHLGEQLDAVVRSAMPQEGP